VSVFCHLRDRAGTRQATLDLPDDASVKDLKNELKQQFPALGPALDSALFAVNRQYAFDEDLLPAGSEVGVFPPVSGGSNGRQAAELPTYFAITEAALDLNDLVQRITLPTTGAACIFSGMVREITRRAEPHETAYLEYEAYQPMAEEKMRQVADEIRGRWPEVEGIAIVQRIGRLDPGTPTVLIACSAAHRDTGVFEAAHYGIDRLKGSSRSGRRKSANKVRPGSRALPPGTRRVELRESCPLYKLRCCRNLDPLPLPELWGYSTLFQFQVSSRPG
jgi:molybdopterin synthase catalytic subunit